ncbi:MAG: hypothetical protein WBM42_13985 [Eudoraea sp.]|uniref:hypothetical protein n=2 Tax=Eudoraea sp. TaxID=1979955 RepID=UPI003C775B6E
MNEVIEDFKNEVTDLYTIYKFNVFGLHLMAQKWDESKLINPNLEEFVLMDKNHGYELAGKKDEIEQGIRGNGTYYKKLCGVFLASMYQLWEDKYRGKIASSIGLTKNDVKSELFGEIGKIRHAIVHNNFEPTQEIKNLKILDFIYTSGVFNLNIDSMSVIFKMTVQELNNLK